MLRKNFKIVWFKIRETVQRKNFAFRYVWEKLGKLAQNFSNYVLFVKLYIWIQPHNSYLRLSEISTLNQNWYSALCRQKITLLPDKTTNIFLKHVKLQNTKSSYNSQILFGVFQKWHSSSEGLNNWHFLYKEDLIENSNVVMQVVLFLESTAKQGWKRTYLRSSLFVHYILHLMHF